MTQNDQPNNPTQTVQRLNALRAIFGDEEQTIVVKVDEHEQLLGYEVRPLADVVAELAINGLGVNRTRMNADLRG